MKTLTPDVRTHLEVAGGVDEQVGGLEVPVQHIGRVNVLKTPQDLVKEVAHMLVAQLLGLQELVQVRLHQRLHDVAGHTHWSRQTNQKLTESHILFTLTWQNLGASYFLFNLFLFKPTFTSFIQPETAKLWAADNVKRVLQWLCSSNHSLVNQKRKKKESTTKSKQKEQIHGYQKNNRWGCSCSDL